MIEYIKDFFKNHGLKVTLFFVGVVAGVFIDPGKNGVYFSLGYPNGEEMFSIGDTQTEKIDLSKMDESEVAMMLTGIKSLPTSEGLGKGLRSMAIRGVGPFRPVEVVVKLNIVDDSELLATQARACRNSMIYENPILAYEVIDAGNYDFKVQGLLGINVNSEKVSTCDNSQVGTSEIWVKKELVNEWLKSDFSSDTVITLKARMIVSGKNLL